jgi:MATE family multidrug resistance protein
VTSRLWALRSPYDREIAVLALPALGALIADPLLSLVDTAFVGRLGEDALGALGVASFAFGVAFYVLTFVEYGTTSLVARAVGAGDPAHAGRASVTAFVLGFLAGIAVTALLLLATEPILSAMGAKGEVRRLAGTYLRIRAWAAPGLMAVRTGHGVYRGFQDTRTPLLVTLGINGVNLALDPILIFGAGMGIAGAAWATLIAQWLGAFVFLGLVFGRHRQRLGIGRARPRFRDARMFFGVARDLMIRAGGLMAVFTLAGAIATRVGDAAIAAHQVVFTLWLFLALALDALAIAAQAMVGRHLGGGDLTTVRRVSDRLLVIGAVLGLGLALLLIVLRPWLAGWFSDDPVVIDAVGSIYWMLVLAQPLGAIVFVWDGVFLGAGDFAYLAVATLAASVLTFGALLAVPVLGWGLIGVWWGINGLLGLRLLTLAWRRWARSSPLRPRPLPGG